MADAALTVVVNDQSFDLAEVHTIAELLERLRIEPRRAAVERNGEVVPRSKHALTPIEQGDRLEIVTLVGGG